MRRHWDLLLVDMADRIERMVRSWSGGCLDEHEVEEGVQRAYIRFVHKLIWTFDGHVMGQLVNATVQLVYFACCDVLDDASRWRKHHWSLDAETIGDDGEARDRWSEELYREAQERQWAEEDRREVTAMSSLLQEVLEEELTDEQREIVLAKYDPDVSDADLAEKYDTTPNNIQQRRRRAIVALGDSERLAELEKEWT